MTVMITVIPKVKMLITLRINNIQRLIVEGIAVAVEGDGRGINMGAILLYRISCIRYLQVAVHAEQIMDSQQFLQSLVDQFNTQSKSYTLLTKKCSELKEEKHYTVHNMRKLDTAKLR